MVRFQPAGQEWISECTLLLLLCWQGITQQPSMFDSCTCIQLLCLPLLNINRLRALTPTVGRSCDREPTTPGLALGGVSTAVTNQYESVARSFPLYPDFTPACTAELCAAIMISIEGRWRGFDLWLCAGGCFYCCLLASTRYFWYELRSLRLGLSFVLTHIKALLQYQEYSPAVMSQHVQLFHNLCYGYISGKGHIDVLRNNLRD